MRIDSGISVAQAVAGTLAAAGIAALARRLGALTTTGMLAAMVVGACSLAAGWRWALVLVLFFVSSTALSALGAAMKRDRIGGRVAKPGARDAAQVFANGGVFAAGALLTTMNPGALVTAAALGALAGAAGDTWATEIGVLSGRRPLLITSLRPVPHGTSGGVTPAGLAAGCLGAAAIAGAAALLRVDDGLAFAIVAGGVAGMLIDSLLGAAVQAQRWCERCGEATERALHRCGAATRHDRGWRWLDNDGVNLLSTMAAATVAVVAATGAAP